MAFLSSFGNSLVQNLNTQLGIQDSSGDLTGYETEILNKLIQKTNSFEQRRYLENGFLRAKKPRNFEIWMQEPDYTVLVKKRHFTSLSENYRPDLMSKDEKLHIRAIKKLFQNKSNALGAYERLSKIEKFVQNDGMINDTTFGMLFASFDVLNNLSPTMIDQKTKNILETIRKIKIFSKPNNITTWLTDPSTSYFSQLGDGTGVIEFTNIESIETTCSVNFGEGSASLTFADPYKLMLITEEDIERAISEVSSFYGQQSFFRVVKEETEITIADLKTRLNQLRKSRNLGEIFFSISEFGFSTPRVIAIVSSIGQPINYTFNGGFLGFFENVTFDFSNLSNGEELNLEEQKLFSKILENYSNLFSFHQSSQAELKTYNKSTNVVRKKMFLEFNGRCMVQPMDRIHIYCSSKTQRDTKINSGLFSSYSADSLLQNLNQKLFSFQNSLSDFKSLFNSGNNNFYLEAEKNNLVGSDFPTWLWIILRNSFTHQGAQTHIFGGIVQNPSHSSSNGVYSLRVSASDQTAYFKAGQININPAVDVFNGDLYDPLTPFKSNFDGSSGLVTSKPELLEENVRLLNTGVVRSKFGRFRGTILTPEVYNFPEADIIAGNFFRRKFHDPDGFIYRWKEGIGTRILFGEPHVPELFQKETSPSITADPFAGQDVMNVLSLLISGQPYNFNNFFRSAILSGNLNREYLLNTEGTRSFLRGLTNDLISQNQIWGNFQPFKKMILNQGSYAFLRNGEFDLSTTNRKLSELLRKRAEKFDELTTVANQFANQPQFYRTGIQGQKIVDDTGGLLINSLGVSKLGTEIIDLDFEIQQTEKNFQKHIQEANTHIQDGTLKIFGDDISFDTSLTNQTSSTVAQKLKAQQELRNRLLSLTYRPIWKVRANEDLNYFIVDDSYDKNYDIQAFEKALISGLSTFRSTYTTVFQQIQGVQQLLGLEVFCDTQGHIQARPPQYNRMPSSVFQKMLQNKKSKGVQIFPEFLENLFFNQLQGVSDKIEIVEDEIRLRVLLLGGKNDFEAQKILGGSTLGAQGSREFIFLTNPDDGKFGAKDVRLLLLQSYAEVDGDTFNRGLNALNQNLKSANLNTFSFDIIQRVSIVNPVKGFNLLDVETEDLFVKIAKRIEQKTSVPAKKQSEFLLADRTARGPGLSQLDLLNLTEQISQFLSERQQLVTLLSRAVQNLSSGRDLNDHPEKMKTLLYPSLISGQDLEYPEILSHMIEDEKLDDLGPGSAERFLLTDGKIISLTVSENPPEWTSVEVNGQLENNLVSLPAGTAGISPEGGGNGIASAFAVDYDMWKHYGHRSPHSVTQPLFSSPESQCAPYAVYLLNLARKNIFKADCTTIGNEYYQPGEVYYIEDRNLLFYIDSVSHSYQSGSNFTSSLRLTYGHSPGEYIPNMLDILGKSLYSKQNPASLVRHVRFGEIENQKYLSSLFIDLNYETGLDSLLLGMMGEENRKSLSNIMLGSLGYLAPNSNIYFYKVQIRIYNNSAKSTATNPKLISAAQAVQDWILYPQKTTLTSDGKSLSPDTENFKPNISKEQIEIIEVDLSDENISLSPSQGAWNLSRLSLLSSDFPNTNLEESVLYSSILDIYFVYDSAEEGVLTNKENSLPNQADQEEKQKYIAAFKQSIGQV